MAEINNAPPDMELKQESGEFSVFPPGYVNRYGKAVMATKHLKTSTIEGVYRFISSERWAGNATCELRKIKEHDENSKYKMMNFFVATFSCIASYRNAQSVTQVSDFMVLDFDEEEIMEANLGDTIEESIAELKRRLLLDQNLATVLMFVSPNGNGIKQVIKVGNKQGLSHREAFDAISIYIHERHGVHIDASGSDICRACFLPYDPDCYFNADYRNLPSCSIDLKVWLKEKHYIEERIRKQHTSKVSCSESRSANDVYELVERWVSKDVAYAKGSFNRYVCKCGYLLCEFGVSEAEATQWAINRFSDYRNSDVKSIFRSCYRYGNFGKREFINKLNKIQS